MRDYDNAGFRPADSRAVPFNVQDDSDILLLIKYIGSQDSGTVTVAAGGDITFKHGAVGSEANDTSVGGVADSGATLDVSDALNINLGLCVDLINSSANWRAVIVDGVRSDLATDTFLAATYQCKVPKGASVLADTSVRLNVTALVAPDVIRTDIGVFLNADGTVDWLKPFKGNRSSVQKLAGVATVTGADVFEVIEENGSGSQVVHTEAGGGTGVEAEALDGAQAEIISQRDYRILARLKAASAFASATMRGQGRLFRALS